MKITTKALLILLLISGYSSGVFAQFEQYNHPELKWETIETEHFVIHYHNGEFRTPRMIAEIAEDIYTPVTKTYKFEPDSKIHFIVRDHDDYANGITYFYDNKIEIWATPLDFILRGSSAWLTNVITHEFTHMIQLQASKKMPRKIPSIYLQVMDYEDEKRPDVLYGFPKRVISYPLSGIVMPNWLAEGTAQYETMKMGYESWDSHRDMIIRLRTLNNELYSLVEMGVFGKTSLGNES
ncbi:MAG: biopolymer transporter Tol, partial [bacterium]|nr:biopolymer transporter Tol [bacterium]